MEIIARKTAIQSTVSLFKYTITLFIFLYQCQNPARQGYNQNDHRDDSHDPEDFCLSYRLLLHASCKSFGVDRHEKGNGKTDRIKNNTYPKFHKYSPFLPQKHRLPAQWGERYAAVRRNFKYICTAKLLAGQQRRGGRNCKDHPLRQRPLC